VNKFSVNLLGNDARWWHGGHEVSMMVVSWWHIANTPSINKFICSRDEYDNREMERFRCEIT